MVQDARNGEQLAKTAFAPPTGEKSIVRKVGGMDNVDKNSCQTSVGNDIAGYCQASCLQV